jgi:hypothetical protein
MLCQLGAPICIALEEGQLFMFMGSLSKCRRKSELLRVPEGTSLLIPGWTSLVIFLTSID